MILYRFLSLYFVQILAIAFCYAQRVETDHLTVKGYFDLDELEDNMVVARKTIFDKDEEGHDNWHASAVYVHGKIRLGNKEMLSFTDYDDLDESQSGGLTYVSPQQGIIIRDLWTQSGCSVMEVYDYYMFDAASHDWYKYKTATYDQATWEELSVKFDYYDREQKPLIGTKLRICSETLKDPMLPNQSLEHILQQCKNGQYPKTCLDFVSCIEILNHVDKMHYQADIQRLNTFFKLHNTSWANYIEANYIEGYK